MTRDQIGLLGKIPRRGRESWMERSFHPCRDWGQIRTAAPDLTPQVRRRAWLLGKKVKLEDLMPCPTEAERQKHPWALLLGVMP